MIEEGRIIALGSAYVEGKILSSDLHLPPRGQLRTFLDAHPEANLYAGGSIPNILTSFVRLPGNPNVKLLCCVGNDPRGKFYMEHMDRRLGEPKVSTRRPTDIWVGIYNNGLAEGMDLYGAAAELTISKEELEAERNILFITDIDVCRIPAVRNPVKRALDTLEDDGLFILSLVGTPSNRSIDQILSFTDRAPDIVFGNVYELLNATNELDINRAIKVAFPASKLVVITQGEKGAIIRFNDQYHAVPTISVPEEAVIDETGAGDSYMGTMLGLLSPTSHSDWNEHDVITAARTASYASSLVIQSMHSRLTSAMAQRVIDYELSLLPHTALPPN